MCSDSDSDFDIPDPVGPFDLKSSVLALPHTSHHEFNTANLDKFVYPVDMQIRDYQRNIIRIALLKNIICALPTGLGKTFIASVVMLNFFNWTKSAKIVFIAPTRPLVAQQVQSFLEISGISINETAILLQSVVDRNRRIEEWQSKRVFFATAQTIENDIQKQIVDPKQFVLLVFDEAHKATGNHSYVNVMRMVSAVNSSFRVLALTATPSGRLDGVQNVINNLQIAATEIRSEESLDIRKYVHQREIIKLEVDQSETITQLMKQVNSAFKEFIDTLVQVKILSIADLSRCHFFAIQQEFNRYVASMGDKLYQGRKFQLRSQMTWVSKACFALQLLKIHGVMPFYTKMHQMELELAGSQGKNAQILRSNPDFKQILVNCRQMIYGEDKGMTWTYKDRQKGFFGHPKLEKLVEEVQNFIMQKGVDTRIIIFAEFRDSAAEIQWVLETQCEESIRSSLFVGQTSSSNGMKGMSQKIQQQVLSQFKEGEFNVLIATSIGEEGLDIGQVDLIICYDQSQSPIRNIQRMGRTGRKRDGRVVMLMTAGEAAKLSNAFMGHKYIRNQINNSNAPGYQQIGLDDPLLLKYHPSVRVFPNNYQPKYTEIKIQTPPENEDALASGDILNYMKQQQKPLKKRKTSKPAADPQEIAKNASLERMGFVPANEIPKSDDEVIFLD